jgi:FtsH-binding integral membrane protein
MLNKITTLLACLLAISFLVGLASTLTRSSMISFVDVIPVYILMVVAIFMMLYEAFFDKK